MSDQPPAEATDIDHDLAVIVGGHFTPDSIGPVAYDALVAKVRLRPGEYLDALERRYLGGRFDLAVHSELFVASLLRIVADLEPARTRDLAHRLTNQLDVALSSRDAATDVESFDEVLAPETARRLRRLEQRRATLRALLA